ncbi:G1/S-specific cyclin-E [Drosophila innubila]|uniref:G1/S-specific cyclin-E n=1 Tax=Drosophila innubila TaxID=198719 RepID=UPI00148C18BA|nr:G1/S-specific cyclin-E [Drosophila innubila]XP_034473757.1 G1/S-specific cyclin-E [Drosophila innubila]
MDLYAKSANTTSSSSSSNNSNINVPLEQIVTPASIDIIESSSGAAATTSSAHHCYWSSVSTTSDMCSCDSQLNATSAIFATGNGKRKRRSSTKDPELGFEPPSAKRQQRLAAVYGSDQSNQSSVASSVYTSPLTATGDALNAQELLSIRSLPAEELSEAPHSPLPDSPDSPPSPDRGAKQQPIVVRYAAGEAEQAKVTEEHGDEEVLDDSSEDYSYEEDDDEDEEINSSSSSPASSTATGCSQNGERTPATQQQLHGPSNGNRTVKLNPLDGATTHNSYKCMSPALEETFRPCPLPALSWANAADVWRMMCKRDELDSHLRSSSMLDQHPGLQPRMRAILLDWLNEVCEVYKLHRDTFYLAVDYLDRYLHGEREVLKTHLQLIGITCLFVAAKVEEIYPPKIGEFAYVTDGACTEHDILQHEKILLQALGWDICPITVTGWLGVYMQLNVNNRTPASLANIGKQAAAGQADDAFIYPQFSGFEFVQTSQLLDLCTLDVGMANYPYSVLAAAAISHTFNRETALRCSGLDWQTVQPCARWMEPFFHVISKKAPYLQLNEQNEQVTNKFGLGHVCPNIVTDDSHIIQTHTTTMDMYDELLMVQNALHAMRARTQASPATALRAPESLLTPPASSHKPDEYLGDEDEVVAATVTATATATATAVSSSSRLVSHKNPSTGSESSGSSSGNGSRV